MDPPPPSQSQATPKTTLFSNPDGTPIRVFIQADLFGRAKVIKELRLNGAELLSDAANAQIMLVDPPTRQGRQFIRDWGQDGNRTVLSFTWVRRCLEAGRPLLEEDLWGESLAQDDGCPIEAGEGSDEVVHVARPNPLPTPRVTPEELAKMRSKTRQPSLNTRNRADDVSMSTITAPPSASNTSLSVPPDTMPSQPLSPVDMSSTAGMNPLMFMQNPAALNMQNIPPSVLAFTAQATQAMMANMLMNANANIIPNQQQPIQNSTFLLALQDSMRNAVAGWPGVQPQNGTFPASQPVSPFQEPPVPYPSAPFTSKKRGASESPPPMSISEPSASRRVSSVSEFESFSRKGKNRARTPSPAAKRQKVSSASEMDIAMDDTREPPHTDPLPDGKLFKTKSGRSLGFFVQIEIHNRFKLVSSIKKNGGVIVDTPTVADYAILYAGNQKQKVFKTWLQAAYNADVPAVQAKFLYDCLSKKKLLNPSNYLYEPEVKRKHKRSVSTASVESESEEETAREIDKAERKRLAKNARQAERRLKIKMEKEEAKQNATPAVRAKTPKPKRARSVDASYPRATDGPRTPSPPPENTRETCPQGFRFSRAEDDFALRFAKVMIDRDHTVSQSAVTNAIHKKLPHHTLLSWRSHFNVIASEWDTWHKRSAIAHRKAQLQKQVEATSGEGIKMEQPAAPNAHYSEQDLEDDMATVVRFFVEGNDRDQSEDESVVWQRLTATIPCKTESNWETFYEKHAQVVVERYNAAI